MNNDNKQFTAKDWGHLPSDCLRFNSPYKKLCRQCSGISESVRRENDNYLLSSELHFHKTLEATLKLYQDRSSFTTWDNFKSVADMLTEIQRSTKLRMQKLFRASYDCGAISFSRDFLYQFGQLSNDNDILCDGSPFQVSKLKTILCSSSDPPRGSFKRRRRIITANRRTNLPSFYPQSSSSDDDDDNVPHLSSASKSSIFLDTESSGERVLPKRARLTSPFSPCLSESSQQSQSPSVCSICSDGCCSDESCSCEDKHSTRHSPSVTSCSSSDLEND